MFLEKNAMLQILRAFWTPGKLTHDQVNVFLLSENRRILRILLWWAPHHLRGYLLRQLVAYPQLFAALETSLLYILSKDSLEKAQLAANILNRQVVKREKPYLLAKAQFEDKLRRSKNKITFHHHYEMYTNKIHLDNKKKMAQLERVRMQLRKGIRSMT